MVKRVARDPAAGVLLALSAVFMLTGGVLVLVSRAGWGLLAVGVLLSGAAAVKVLSARPGKSTCRCAFAGLRAPGLPVQQAGAYATRRVRLVATGRGQR